MKLQFRIAARALICLLACWGAAAAMADTLNQSGIWWNPAQGGHGLTIQRNAQGTTFAVWFTYDKAGRPTWYEMPNGQPQGPNAVTGQVFHPRGPSFRNPVFDPALVETGDPVGSFRIEWQDDTDAVFSYDVEGVQGSTKIQSYLFTSDHRQIMWNPKESGWGFAKYYGTTGTTFAGANPPFADFAIWYTYDDSGEATWFAISDSKHQVDFDDERVFGGIYRYSGPPLSPVFDPTQVHGTAIGFSSYGWGTFTGFFTYAMVTPEKPAGDFGEKDFLKVFEF